MDSNEEIIDQLCKQELTHLKQDESLTELHRSLGRILSAEIDLQERLETRERQMLPSNQINFIP